MTWERIADQLAVEHQRLLEEVTSGTYRKWQLYGFKRAVKGMADALEGTGRFPRLLFYHRIGLSTEDARRSVTVWGAKKEKRDEGRS